jgi:hypothetical protein
MDVGSGVVVGGWGRGGFRIDNLAPITLSLRLINVLPSTEVYELVLVSQPALASMVNVQKGGKGKDRYTWTQELRSCSA